MSFYRVGSTSADGQIANSNCSYTIKGYDSLLVEESVG